MMDARAKPVVEYFVRLIAGVTVLVGLLMVFSSPARGDLFGVVLGLVLAAGGAFVFKRSSRTRRAE